MEGGFDPKHGRVVDRLVDRSAPGRRRLDYHALARLACLGELTPYALDPNIEVADTDDGLVVHTSDYAPAVTDLDDSLRVRYVGQKGTDSDNVVNNAGEVLWNSESGIDFTRFNPDTLPYNLDGVSSTELVVPPMTQGSSSHSPASGPVAGVSAAD